MVQKNLNIVKACLVIVWAITNCLNLQGQNIELSLLSRYDHSLPAGGEVEIIAPYDSVSQRLFVNLQKDKVTIIDLSDPSLPDSVGGIDLTPFGTLALNIAVKNSLVAIAVQGPTKQDSGSVVIFDTNGAYINEMTAGPAPGMLSFTPNGRYIVVANEGVPTDDYLNDPEGSISIIDLLNGPMSATVDHIGFSDYNIGAIKESLFPSTVHVYGPGATRAQDLEPEFIAINDDGQKAYVSLQENNAVMVIDIPLAIIDTIFFLGYKNHGEMGNELDASDQDGAVNIASWPVHGMYQPDGIASFSKAGVDYFLTANEGASRKYSTFDEENRMANLALDTTDFSNISSLQGSSALGRLKVTTAFGDEDQDGKLDNLYCYGGRSFSIWNALNGDLVYDSGNDFESKTAILTPNFFNSAGTASSFDSRSDNKGPEPEDVVIGHLNNSDYAFIGLEQVGGIMIYDISEPSTPVFIDYEPAANGDISPEASVFISSQQSPIGQPLLVVSHEESSTLAIYAILESNSILENTPEIITLFPNPTSSILTIKGAEGIIDIYDIYGRKLITSDTNTIDLSSFNDGIYFLKATDRNGKAISRRIVKN